MSNELQTINNDQAVIGIIKSIAENPNLNVDAIKELVALQSKVSAEKAEISFNRAMSLVQREMPIIQHKSEIKHSGKLISTYSKYEDVDRIARPIYSKHGFTVGFNQELDGKSYSITVCHIDGHKRTHYMAIPNDKSGSKNEIQAIGSSTTYAKRYLLCMAFNISTSGDDDDAESLHEVVNNEQAVDIDQKIREVGADKEKFLIYMKVSDVREIRAVDYGKAMAALAARGAKK